MTAATIDGRSTARRPQAAQWKHGTQLALAVVGAYALAHACGLPENFWAVMSALIVVRPNVGATLGAGWDRVRGVLAGTAFGLVGVWLHHRLAPTVGDPAFVTLVAVAALAGASAVVPALRAAPISALIVLTSGGLPGHSPLDVAWLRAVEIAIGVATGIVVSLAAFASQARVAFDAAMARWLDDAAAHARVAIGADRLDAAARERRADASRRALRELTIVASAADREAVLAGRLRGRKADDGRADARLRQARLLARTSADVDGFVRAVHAAPEPLDDALRARAADAVADLLASLARLYRGRNEAGLGGAGRSDAGRSEGGRSGAGLPVPRPIDAFAGGPASAWLAPHARLLHDTARQLHGLHARLLRTETA